MKNCIFLLFSFLIVSCTKVADKDMLVIRDCTGTYLQYDEKDYHVCNADVLLAYDSGDEVNASFEKIDDCNQNGQITCEMFHQNEGWIKVTEVE